MKVAQARVGTHTAETPAVEEVSRAADNKRNKKNVKIIKVHNEDHGEVLKPQVVTETEQVEQTDAEISEVMVVEFIMDQKEEMQDGTSFGRAVAVV